MNLGAYFAFHVKLMCVINAIEFAFPKGWWNLWLETDFMLVTLAYKSPTMHEISSM
jgi:hypothetical protein